MMDDLFNTDLTPTEPESIPAEDYVGKTKNLLESILKAYSDSLYKTSLTEEDDEITPCQNCKGSGRFTKDEKEITCYMHRDEGECFKHEFDKEAFFDELEDIMFHKNNDFFQLMQSSISYII